MLPSLGGDRLAHVLGQNSDRCEPGGYFSVARLQLNLATEQAGDPPVVVHQEVQGRRQA